MTASLYPFFSFYTSSSVLSLSLSLFPTSSCRHWVPGCGTPAVTFECPRLTGVIMVHVNVPMMMNVHVS